MVGDVVGFEFARYFASPDFILFGEAVGRDVEDGAEADGFGFGLRECFEGPEAGFLFGACGD